MSEDEQYRILKNQKIKTEGLICPENQELWTHEHPQSKEFKEIADEINAITAHIVNLINHGPEVSGNSAKRVMLAKAIMKTVVTYTFITSIDRLGILEAIKDDLNAEARAKMFQKVIDGSLGKQESLSQKDTEKRGYVT